MDHEKAKLRTDLTALARQTAALSARVEALERQAAEEALAKSKAAEEAKVAAAAAAKAAAKRLFGPKAK